MGSLSVIHWLIMILMLVIVFASPILGIVRGVKNGSAINAVLSAFFPLYGLIYFFAAKR
jgi:choline-glycine betaine transporter